jgi:hypothetical protein
MGLTKEISKRPLMETCEWCNQIYTHIGKPTKHKACGRYCRDAIKINESNKKWVSREPRKPDPRPNRLVEMSILHPLMMNESLKKYHAGRRRRED